MLPPGHIAGGYLAALAAAKLFGNDIPELNTSTFLALGAFMGFAPDLDVFYKFSQVGRMYNSETSAEDSHRKYYSHAPLIYLFIAAIWFFFGLQLNSTLAQALAIIFLFGSWSHFFLDTLESSGNGIRWLMPFSKKVFSLFPQLMKRQVSGDTFFFYWFNFVKHYAERPEFYLELGFIIAGIWVFLS